MPGRATKAHKTARTNDQTMSDEAVSTQTAKRPRLNAYSRGHEELDDEQASPASRWQASPELTDFIESFCKTLQPFDRKAICRQYPRPDVEAAYTPTIDNYLCSLVPGVKQADKDGRFLQDRVLDILGHMSFLYEHLNLILHQSEEESSSITLSQEQVKGLFKATYNSMLSVGNASALLSIGTASTEVTPAPEGLGAGATSPMEPRTCNSKSGKYSLHSKYCRPQFKFKTFRPSSFAPGGQTKTLPSKLAINLQRPLGFESYRRLSHRLHKSPLSDKASSRHYHTQAESNLIENEVQVLLKKQAIHPVPVGQGQDGFVSNLFLVPKKGGGQRPVINLKHLNQFVMYEHFKMENIHMLRTLLKERRLSGQNRFEGCLLHDPCLGESPKNSEVSLEGDSLRVCLPSIRTCFSPAGFQQDNEAGSRTIAPVGDTHCNLYLEDMPIMSQTQEMAKCHATTIVNLIESLGLTVNYHKSVLIPSTTIEFLGFLVDSKTLTLSLPKEMIKKAKKVCQLILDNPLPSIQQLS